MTKDDYVIICGDFGFIWSRDITPTEAYWLKWFDNKPWTTLFVDGNHENHARLDALPVETWNGGKVHRISESVLHLMRGQIFTIDNTSIFTMGGAASHDKAFRRENISWWAREMPSKAECREALRNLKKHNWCVDVIITHCAPTQIQACIDTHYVPDNATEFLATVYSKTKFKKWFCGHYHVNDVSIFDDRINILYEEFKTI